MRKKKIVPVMCFALLMAVGCAKGQKAGQASIPHSFYWGGTICTGSYTGEIQEGKPYGEGTFHGYVMRDGKEQDEVSYTGKWKEGRIAGKGTFTNISKAVSYDGKFANNTKNGEIVVQQENSDTYEKITFHKDIPYGISVLYDAETDQVTGYDRYYKGMRVSEIMADARKFNYAELIYDANGPYYEKIYLDCEVEEKFLREIQIRDVDEEEDEEASPEMETELTAWLKVKDAQGNFYLVSYNIEYPKMAENYMPDIAVGEKIRIYGFTGGMAGEDENASAIAQYPLIHAVTATKENRAVDFKNLVYEYQNFLDYPYEYKECKAEFSGKVREFGTDPQGELLLMVESETYSAGEGKYYACVYDSEGDYDALPVIGDSVRVSGTLDMAYLKSEGGDFHMYPRILVSDISFIE